MKKLGKRGEGLEGTLKDSVLSIVVIIILLIAGAGYATWTYARSKEQRCSMTSWANDLTDKKSDLFGWPLDCPAPHENIYVKDDEKIYGAIATQLKTCWQKAGGGGRNVLGTPLWVNPIGQSNCLVCSTFSINKEISWLDVTSYLEARPVPPANVQTYSEFLDTDFKKKMELRLSGSKIDLKSYEGQALIDHVGNLLIYRTSGFSYSDPSVYKLAATEGNDHIKYLVVYWYDNRDEISDVLATDNIIEELAKIGNIDSIEIGETTSGVYTIYVIKEGDFSNMKCATRYWQRDDTK